MKLETLAVHAGHDVEPGFGDISPAIHLSTTFERDVDGAYSRGHMYSRQSNPNRNSLEKALTAIEGGEQAAAFSSGSAATMSVLQSLAPGDHVLFPDNAYYGTLKMSRELLERWGLEFSTVDMTQPENVRAGIRPNTRIVWIETPSNPLLKITDIAAVTEIAQAHGALSVCDNTFAPLLQRPLALGADMVMYATTKFISGHSDVLGGAIIARRELEFFDRVRSHQKLGGAVPSPFECWLLLRSLPTLPLRMEAQSRNAESVAEWLSKQAVVESVHYPGLEFHPGHSIARAQMSAMGAMMSFQIRGSAQEALKAVAAATVFRRATSLGGVESLIEHRASVEGPNSTAPANLVRVSIGLEHPSDLIADLGRALDALK